MSKKVVRVRKSYVKQWFAVISGSLFASAMQAAHASDVDRPSFREFRDKNPGIDRQALRQMFRTEFGNVRNGRPDVSQVPQIPQTFVATPAITGTVNVIQNNAVRPDRLTRRLERNGGVLNQSVQGGDGSLVNLRHGVNLDLTSIERNITLGNNLFKGVGSVEINIGGETKTVQAGTQVTASEYVAVKQVLAGAGQKLTLDAVGKATGGELDLGSITANNDVMRASDLVVPVNVTTYGDFGKGSDFKLQGDLTNYGSVYAVSSSRSVRGGTIHADDITNQEGGLISSVISNSLKSKLDARGRSLDLGLNARGDLSNYGSITSSGNLTLTAGGNLTNTAEVSAKNDVNLNAPTIANSGRVESFKGNVNLDGPTTAELNVNNAGGTIAALNGAINVRNSSFSEVFNTNVSGGDLLSRELNVNAGGGISRVNVNELTGTINQIGSEAHFQAATAELNIGEVCLTGDPTFKNSAGNINITGDIIVAEDLAIIASGNITSVNNVTIAAVNGAQGHDITIIAGAQQLPGGTDSGTLPGGTQSGTTLTGFASTGGGSVLMGNGVEISSTGTNPLADPAGDIFIAAFAGSNFNSGRVILGGAEVNSSSLFGNAGDITIIAGAQNTTAITLGDVGAYSTVPGQGNINVVTAQPVSSNGGNIVFNANGQITSPNALIAGAISTGANIQINAGDQWAGTNFNIRAGGNINQSAGSVIEGRTVALEANGNITNSVNSEVLVLNTLSLTSHNGNIGTSTASRFNTNADTLAVSAVNGSAFIANDSPVVIATSNVANTYDVQATGTITSSGVVSADVVSIRSTAGSIDLTHGISATTSATLHAFSDLDQTAVITAPQVNLRSDTGNINVGINANNLIVNALNGNALIQEANSVNLGGGNSFVSGSFVLNALGSITSTSNVTADSINFVSGASFGIAGNITTADYVTLSSVANIENANITGNIVTPSLYLGSGGNIGTSSSNPLNIDANNLEFGADNVWLSDPNTVNLIGSSVSLGDIQITANNNVTSTGTLNTTADVTLTATNGSLVLGGQVNGYDVTLTAFNSITNSSIAGGVIVANLLTLNSTNGSIGSSANPLNVDAPNVAANANSNVYLSNASAVTNTIEGTAGLDFSYTATNGDIEISDSVVGGRHVSIRTTFGDIEVLSGSNVTSTGGNLSFEAVSNFQLEEQIETFGDLTISAGTVNLNDDVTAGGDINIEALTGSLNLNFSITAGGNVTATGATSVNINDAITATTGDIDITGDQIITLDGSLNAGRDIRLTSLSSMISTIASPSNEIEAGRDVFLTSHMSIQNRVVTSGRNVSFTSFNGGVFNDEQVTATSSINVDQFDNFTNANILNNETLLDAPQINLTTVGSIGSLGDFLNIDAVSLTLNAGADVFVSDPNDLNLGGGASSSLDQFRVSVGGAMTTTGTITGDFLVLGAVNGITIGADVFSNAATISGSGTFMTVSEATVFGTTSVSFNVSTGDIGSSSNRFLVDTTQLSVNSLVGDAYLHDANSVNVNLVSMNGVFDVVAENNVTVLTITAGDVYLTATTGSVQINGMVVADSAYITAAQSITDANNIDSVIASYLSLTSTGGDIGSTGIPVTLSANTNVLTANASAGNVYVTASSPVGLILLNSSTAQGDFSVTSQIGVLNVSGTVEATDVVLDAATSFVTLNGTVTGSSSIAISSAENIYSSDIPLGSLVAPTISLAAPTGEIGLAGAPVLLDTDNLILIAQNDAWVENVGNLNVISASAQNLEITAHGDLSSTGLISGSNVTLVADGSFDLDGLVSGSTSISLSAGNSIFNSSIAGGLDNGGGSAVPFLSLLSLNGDIGMEVERLLIDADNLTANAPNGSVYITDLNTIAVSGPSAAGNTFSLSSPGQLSSTVTGTITADVVELISTGSSLLLDGLVTGLSSISLNSSADITDASITGGLSSDSINLKSDNNINIATVDFINVSALAFNGSVVLTDTTGSMNIGDGASFALTTFTATAPVNITNSGTVDADAVSLTATTGGFTFNNVVTGDTSITLTSADDILNGVGLGQLITNSLNATSTGGDIGQALDPLDVNVASLVLNAPTGSVYVSNASAVAIGGPSGAANDFVLNANGQIDVNGAVSADNVELIARAGSGSYVQISAPVSATTSVTISSDDSIYSDNFAAAVTSPRINLIATTGDIGEVDDYVVVDTDVLSIQAAGNAYVSDVNSVDIAAASASDALFIEAGTNLSNSGVIEGADVSLTATAGSLMLNELVRGTNSISLTSANSILNANIAGGLDSGEDVAVNQLNLTVTAGNIGDINDLLSIDADNVSANASGGVFLVDVNNLNLGGGNSSSGATEFFQVVTGFNLTSTSDVSGGQVLLSSGASFDLDGSVTGALAISLYSENSLLNSNISGGLVSPVIDLTSASGNVGQDTDPLAISTGILRVQADAGSAYVTNTGALNLRSTSSAMGTLSVSASGALTLENTAADLSATDVVLSGGSLTLSRTIAATGNVFLSSGAGISQTAGSVNGAALSVEFVTGPVTLATNVSSLTTDAAGQTLTINEQNGIVLLSQTLGTLNVNASLGTSGDVTTGADFTVANLNIVNGNGNITIDNDVTATTAMTLNTSAGAGFIQQTDGTLTTPSLTVLAGVGGIGGGGNELNISNGAAAMALNANATGGGDVAINYDGTGVLTLAASAGNDNFTVTTSNLGDLMIGGSLTGLGQLTLFTDDLTNENSVIFTDISISSPTGASLVIDGGAGGFFTSTTGVEIVSDGDINLFGTMTFDGAGDTTMSVGGFGFDFIVNTGALVTGVNTLTVNACDLFFNGTIIGDPLVIVCGNNGTIANSTGDVVLASDLVFIGQNLAILAAGNITTSGSTLIDLSGPSDSGSLTLMAGYDFTPATGGQVQSPLLYTIDGVSADGGSIDLGGVSIVLQGGTGNGGNLTAVANSGSVNDGSITLGSIDTTGAVNGGDILVIAPNDLTVGNIDTTGGSASGDVTLAVATPTIVGGPVTVQNGVLLSGSFEVGAQTNGMMEVNNIVATGAAVSLTGALDAITDHIVQGSGTIEANRLSLVIGDGSVAFIDPAINELNVSANAGSILLDGVVTSGLLLNNISGNMILTVVADGPIETGASAITAAELYLGTSVGGITLNGDISGSTNIFLDSADEIVQNAGTIGGGELYVGFGVGPVSLNTNVASLSTGSGDSLTINEANDLVLEDQFVGDLNVNVANGNVTTSDDFSIDNLSINVANGTLVVTDSIGSLGTTNVFADDGVTTAGPGVISGNIVNLSSNADLGVHGANKLQVDAAEFSVDAANAFVHNHNTLPAILLASTADGTLDVSTAGDLVSGGNYTAPIVILATGGDFDVTNTINGSTSISLTTDGDLTNIVGTLNTPTLLLNSVNGNVGTDANNPFLVAANVSTIGGTAGDGFFVTSAATGGVNFGAITAGEDISIKANGGLNLTQNITSTNGAFSVEATQSILDIADGISILAHDQIDITMLGSTKKRDKIVIGNGASIVTNAKTPGLGNVNIILGAPQSPGRKTPTPKKNVTIVEIGGSVLFGGKKAQAAGPGIVFTAQGADVYVSTFNPKSIVFEGNNIITADPPVAQGTPVLVQEFTSGNGQLTQPAALGATTTISGDVGLHSSFGSMFSALNLNAMPNISTLSSTADLQMVSLNNATVNNSLMTSLSTGSGTSDLMNSTVKNVSLTGAVSDDSFMTTTSAPAGTMLNASICTDLSFAGDAGLNTCSAVKHSELVSLDHGSVVFAPTVDTTVVTPKGKVKVAANAVAMVVVDGNHLSVYDVNDLRKNSVVVETAGRAIPLSPGQHAVVTHAGVEQFAEINPVESIMHRSMSRHELGNGRRAFVSEFSVPSAIQTVKPLAAMVLSNHTQAKKVKERIFKTSAIIMQLSSGTSYEFHTKPRTVALEW